VTFAPFSVLQFDFDPLPSSFCEMDINRPSTPEWARTIIAENEKSAARMKKWSEEFIATLKPGTFAKPQKSPPSTSHQKSATPSFVGFTRSLYSAPPPSACRTCRQQFTSRNALFVHLNASKHFLKSILPKAKTSSQTPSPGTIISSYAPTIIASNAPSENVGTGAAYKDFSYCEIQYKLTDQGGPASWGCADTGSGMSLVNRKALDSIPWWETKHLKKIEAVVGIKGVGDDSVPYTSKETIVLNVFLPDLSGKRFAKVRREFHIVDNLDCGLLIGNDIIELEGIVIDLAKRKAHIRSCENMVCQLRLPRRGITNYAVRTSKRAPITVGQGQMKCIPIRFPDLDKHTHYTFKPDLDIAASYFKGCTLQNKLMGETKLFSLKSVTKEDITITVPKGLRLGHIQSPEPPHYSTILPVTIHKISPCNVEKPQRLVRSSTVTNEVATVSVDATSLRQVPKKTKSSYPLGSTSVSPKRARYPPSLRTVVPSFYPIHSFGSPLRRSPFFLYRPQYFSFPFPPPSTTNQGFNCPLGFYSYPFCRRPTPSLPPKPGLQLPLLVKLFTCGTNC
jgi:hypothetical protein